ncbi:hypothetical protein WN48_04253 [Eufriesea mexicana]|uniref:Uncharacterized protein n=1 Tax=Eufriesea mexicana TaxID=516756 RepID=A0A310S9Z9_9HYME|nr:hypothetical protein WN48_04253 [Eufriesea mexicana]
MDVVAAGKSEHGRKYELGIRGHRRRRRRNAKLTEVGRFARRKRERKKSGTRYEARGRGLVEAGREKSVYRVALSKPWFW